MTPKWSECPSNNYRELSSQENGECKSSLTETAPSSTSYFGLPAANRMCSLSAQKKDGNVYKRRKMDKDSNSLTADEELKETATQSCAASEDHSSLLLPVVPSDATISNSRSGKIDPILECEEPPEVSLEPNSVVNDRCSISSTPPSFMMLDKKDAAECSSSNISPTEPITELTSARDLCIATLRKDGLITEPRTRITTEELTDHDANHLLACKGCANLEHPLKMLTCDSCEAAFHLSCCIPRIKELPTDEWYCLPCLRKKPKSLYGKLLEGNVKTSVNINQRPHGMSHIEYMLKDTEPYVTGVRIGRDFQAEVPEWSGPTSSVDLPLDPKMGQLMAQEQMSPPIVFATEEFPAEEILLVEGPPRTTEEVVQDVLTTTIGTSKGMSQDVEVQTEGTSQEDQTEEVIRETTEAQDEDHILEPQDTSADPTIGVFRLVQLEQPEDEISLERLPPRTEKKDFQVLMTSVKRCWRINIDMVEEIKTFAEEKEKECLLAKAGQENAESALQSLKLKLSEVEKRFESSVVAMVEKTEEVHLLTQKNEKLQEILSRQSKESHDLFEQNKMLVKKKEELEKEKEDLQKTSSNKDLQIQDFKEAEKQSRTTVQELEKKVETLMKASKEITTVTGSSFSQISASLREIAEHLKAPVTPLATKMTLDDLRNDIYTQIKYIQKHIPIMKNTIYQSLTRAMSQALNRVLLKINLLYGDSVDLQKLVPAPKFKTKEAGVAAQARITLVVAEIIKNIEASVPALPSNAPSSSIQK